MKTIRKELNKLIKELIEEGTISHTQEYPDEPYPGQHSFDASADEEYEEIQGYEEDSKSDSQYGKVMKWVKEGIKYVKLFNESGILYKAGVKKYGKDGMKKIQQAAGKRLSHAQIGAIKDKYEKGKKDEGKLTEAEIWFNPKEFEPFLKKIGLNFPKYPKQGDVLYKGKTVGYMSNFNGFMVYSKALLKQLQKVEKKYKLGIWNPTSGLTMEGKLTEAKKIKYKKNDWKKINKIAKKKDVMIQSAFGDEFKWEEGSSHGVFASESSGREIELTHDDIDIVVVY